MHELLEKLKRKFGGLPFSAEVVKCEIGDFAAVKDKFALAGKTSAALYRAWRNWVKGRDWFDLEWYVRNGAAINLRHLAERGRVSSPEVDLSSPEAVKAAFLRRIDKIDFVAARDDVCPFVKDASVLDIWSKEYLSALTDKMRFV